VQLEKKGKTNEEIKNTLITMNKFIRKRNKSKMIDESLNQMLQVIEKDEESNIKYNNDKFSKIKILGATTPKLIEKALNFSDTGEDFVTKLILVFKIFCDPSDFLCYLINIFHCVSKDALPLPLELFKKRACFFLSEWLSIHFDHFSNNVHITNKLLSFVSQFLDQNSSDHIISLLKQRVYFFYYFYVYFC
jgi:hypothetical protein